MRRGMVLSGDSRVDAHCILYSSLPPENPAAQHGWGPFTNIRYLLRGRYFLRGRVRTR